MFSKACHTSFKRGKRMTFLKWCLLLGMIPVVFGSDFPHLDHIKPSVSKTIQTNAVSDLIQRMIGNQSSHFHIVIDDGIGPQFRDTFNILSDGTQVTISGTSGVAASMGFYYFLKKQCGCQFTWAGYQLELPNPLPVITMPGITVTSNDRFRYYQNVCTVSYSFVWWNWTRWEREIDWMAINGINLPLAFTGQEAIFQRVYLNMGFDLKDLETHFGGPAFLAWARMGNMHGWGGPLPQSWIKNQLELQHKILDRMRSLGMIPVLPGFAGHVPAAITRLFPNASVSQLTQWGHFDDRYCCTYLLDFQDSLFQKIGAAFIQEMKAEFGIDHIYNADTFNEMTPKSSEWSYLQSAGKAVYSAMIAGDPDAVWLMQGWLFQSSFWQPKQIEALLTSVPQGRMIVLDLMAEIAPIYVKTNSFYGQPFIWCMLHNFGGTMELYGIIGAINEGPFIGRRFPNSSMIGTGLTPEGIFQNEAIYEFMNENAYVKEARNLTEWFTNFAVQRYGQFNQHAINAWQLLKRSVFNNTDSLRDHSKQVIPTSRPRLHPLDPDVIKEITVVRFPVLNQRFLINVFIPYNIDKVWYNPTDLYNAWKEMIQAAQMLSSSHLFRYDLVDIGRNSLQVMAINFYTDIVTAYHNKNQTLLSEAGEKLMNLLSDLNKLLESDSHFLLGTWLRDARKNGVTKEEKDLMEYNARNQITLWGPTGEIRDYACKQWAGLTADFYAPRWHLFIQMLQDSLEKGITFNQTAYDILTFEKIEQLFTFDRREYPTVPVGDPIQISSNLFAKYQPVMESGCNSDFPQRVRNTSSKQGLKLAVLQQKYHGRSFRSNFV